jgi:uncharacterized protein
MQTINLRSFRQKVRHHKRGMKSFLTRIGKNPPRDLHKIVDDLETEVWKDVDCLSCANCCKTMSPTYNKADIRRISKHFSLTVPEFTKKYLRKDREGDMLNKTEPCPFLDLNDNKCSIYAIRPLDCSGFPHLRKRKMVDYLHVHKQNVECCPATYRLVEKMQEVFLNNEQGTRN